MNHNSTLTKQKQQWVACYRIILEAARKKRLREEKQPTVRGKFGDQTQTVEECAATEKPSARIA